MKVIDFIKKLQQFDPEMDFKLVDNFTFTEHTKKEPVIEEMMEIEGDFYNEKDIKTLTEEDFEDIGGKPEFKPTTVALLI